MAKKKMKINKKVSKLMESHSNMVKKNKKGGYNYKGKVKKALKTSCCHWIFVKRKPTPMTVPDMNDPTKWKCSLCKATFHKRPRPLNEIHTNIDACLEDVNQLLFFAVPMGGGDDDIATLLNLKKNLRTLKIIAKEEIKHINKRAEYEQRQQDTNGSSQFQSYASYQYNN